MLQVKKYFYLFVNKFIPNCIVFDTKQYFVIHLQI